MQHTLITINIPARFVRLCNGWAGDTDCMLRAIDSTGALTLGSNRPYSNDVGRYLTDEEWQVKLFDNLAADIRHIFRLPFYDVRGRKDYKRLRAFELWAEFVAARLRAEYDLESSDAV